MPRPAQNPTQRKKQTAIANKEDLLRDSSLQNLRISNPFSVLKSHSNFSTLEDAQQDEESKAADLTFHKSKHLLQPTAPLDDELMKLAKKYRKRDTSTRIRAMQDILEAARNQPHLFLHSTASQTHPLNTLALEWVSDPERRVREAFVDVIAVLFPTAVKSVGNIGLEGAVWPFALATCVVDPVSSVASAAISLLNQIWQMNLGEFLRHASQTASFVRLLSTWLLHFEQPHELEVIWCSGTTFSENHMFLRARRFSTSLTLWTLCMQASNVWDAIPSDAFVIISKPDIKQQICSSMLKILLPKQASNADIMAISFVKDSISQALFTLMTQSRELCEMVHFQFADVLWEFIVERSEGSFFTLFAEFLLVWSAKINAQKNKKSRYSVAELERFFDSQIDWVCSETFWKLPLVSFNAHSSNISALQMKTYENLGDDDMAKCIKEQTDDNANASKIGSSVSTESGSIIFPKKERITRSALCNLIALDDLSQSYAADVRSKITELAKKSILCTLPERIFAANVAFDVLGELGLLDETLLRLLQTCTTCARIDAPKTQLQVRLVSSSLCRIAADKRIIKTIVASPLLHTIVMRLAAATNDATIDSIRNLLCVLIEDLRSVTDAGLNLLMLAASENPKLVTPIITSLSLLSFDSRLEALCRLLNSSTAIVRRAPKDFMMRLKPLVNALFSDIFSKTESSVDISAKDKSNMRHKLFLAFPAAIDHLNESSFNLEDADFLIENAAVFGFYFQQLSATRMWFPFIEQTIRSAVDPDATKNTFKALLKYTDSLPTSVAYLMQLVAADFHCFFALDSNFFALENADEEVEALRASLISCFNCGYVSSERLLQKKAFFTNKCHPSHFAFYWRCLSRNSNSSSLLCDADLLMAAQCCVTWRDAAFIGSLLVDLAVEERRREKKFLLSAPETVYCFWRDYRQIENEKTLETESLNALLNAIVSNGMPLKAALSVANQLLEFGVADAEAVLQTLKSAFSLQEIQNVCVFCGTRSQSLCLLEKSVDSGSIESIETIADAMHVFYRINISPVDEQATQNEDSITNLTHDETLLLSFFVDELVVWLADGRADAVSCWWFLCHTANWFEQRFCSKKNASCLPGFLKNIGEETENFGNKCVLLLMNAPVPALQMTAAKAAVACGSRCALLGESIPMISASSSPEISGHQLRPFGRVSLLLSWLWLRLGAPTPLENDAPLFLTHLSRLFSSPAARRFDVQLLSSFLKRNVDFFALYESFVDSAAAWESFYTDSDCVSEKLEDGWPQIERSFLGLLCHVILECVDRFAFAIRSLPRDPFFHAIEAFLRGGASVVLAERQLQALEREAPACLRASNQTATSTFSIKTLCSSTTRQVVASYAFEEARVELHISFPPTFPLAPPHASSHKKVGISPARWRAWLLNTQAILAQTASAASAASSSVLLHALLRWRANADKRFEGVADCTICFCIFHAVDASLPSQTCRTCLKKFHSACLYKWFVSSGNSTCPMCRAFF